MSDEFYMRVGITENLINPQIKLDGKWEVSLCDISINDPSLQIGGGGERSTRTKTLGFRKIRKSDFPKMLETEDRQKNIFMLIQIQIRENRLLRLDSETSKIDIGETNLVKKAFREYNYGNNAQYGTQSNDFDKWMNDLRYDKLEDERPGWIIVENRDMLKLWEEDPNKEITLQELFMKINSEIIAQKRSIETHLKGVFSIEEEADVKLLSPPYWTTPEFNYKNGYVTFKTPYYVYRVWASEDLVRLIKFDYFGRDYLTLKHIFERYRFKTANFLRGVYGLRQPNRIYQFPKENYYINTPCRKIVSYLPGETSTTTTTTSGRTILFNVKVDGGVLEETRIGSKFDSILRLVWIKKGEIYRQFQHRIYVPLRYDTLSNFNIRVINTTNNQQAVTGFAILHFRKRYE